MKMRDSIVSCDVLVVGGGIGGLEAAAAAAKSGARTVVAEKANVRRSGCGANGNDHFLCYIPGVHESLDRAVREVGNTLDGGPWVDQPLLRVLLEHTFPVVQRWESLGINMRPTGEYHFEGHSVPGQERYHLKFDGRKQKQALSKYAASSGAVIMNRVVISELLVQDGRVAGAIGVDINEEEPEMVVFQAKSVVVTSGMAMRLYPTFNPAYLFNVAGCPANCGSGHALAWRAGAKLVNIDIPNCHAGPKYFQRGGKGTWIGISCDIHGDPVTPYVGKPSRKLGDVTADVWPSVYRDKMKDGTGPVYMNCTALSEEDMAYMREAFKSEGIDSIFDYLDQNHISLRDEMVEFGTFNFDLNQKGIQIDEHGASSLPGLYAAGNVVGNVKGNLAGAAVFGELSGTAAAEYARHTGDCDVSGHPLIAEKRALYEGIMNREHGSHWRDANTLLQQIMEEYVGSTHVRSENLFRAGLKYLNDLRNRTRSELKAENAHELMRCLEVLDLIDLGEAVALAGRNRKESRELHQRVDYPYTDLTLNGKFMTIWKSEDGVNFEYRPRR